MPNIPRPTLYGDTQASPEEMPSARDPPPSRCSRNTTHGKPGRPISLEQTRERPGTWHASTREPNMDSSVLPESLFPPIANHRSFEPIPSVHTTTSCIPNRPELYGTGSMGITDVYGGDNRQAVEFPPYSAVEDVKNTRQRVDEYFPTIVNEITTGKASQKSPPKSPTAPPIGDTQLATAPKYPTQMPKAERPYLSFPDARQIREQRGSLPPQHRDLLNDLKHRDHAFLMDDSITMKHHWPAVIDLFSVFAYLIKKLDDDGLEMYFTVSPEKMKFKNTTKAVSHLKSMTHRTFSNIDSRLQQILGKYQDTLDLRRERRNYLGWGHPLKPLSLYIFTDAAWQGCECIAPIEKMIEKQRQHGFSKEQVSIQFIRFGNDADGIKRLKYLDAGLRKKHGKQWDIVDTEPFEGGNLLKMFLGATFDWFDDDDDD